MIDVPLLTVVEDDPEIRALLADYLVGEGYEVSCVENGTGLDLMLEAGPRPDLVILDWMLPGEDGLSILRRLRATEGPPVIMLTAKDEDIDRILGLELGADDYVSKPFVPRVLLARIRAVLRRTRPGSFISGSEDEERRKDRAMRVVDLTVDPERRSVSTETQTIPLTAAEFDLLLCFVNRPGRVLSRDQLLDWTRGRATDGSDRTVDVQLSRLRRKLDEGGSSVAGLLKTVRNAGYILAAPVTRS